MEQNVKELRKCALELSHACRDGNLQSVFSCIDIVWVLYDRIMKWSVSNPLDEDRDYFIISKGQATLALYPVLISKGLFEYDNVISEIGQFNSRYCIQTDLTKFSGGIENNAGSLGHGLPFAVGMAYAGKIKNSTSVIFALCGDGEFCEGTMWESCLFACAKSLDNLCVIIDDNSSVTAMINMGDMHEKLEAFGFEVCNIDGHDQVMIEEGINSLINNKNGKPKAVIAKTIRGYGSRTMTENDIWFHKAPNEEELKMLIAEVDAF